MTSPFFDSIEELKNAPIIVYGVDEGEVFQILDKDKFTNNIEQIHYQALSNLETILSDHPGWKKADISEIISETDVIEYSGHYFSAEAILIPSIIYEAHKRLQANQEPSV